MQTPKEVLEDLNKGEDIYKSINRRRLLLFVIVTVVLAMVCIIDLVVGPSGMPLSDVISTLLQGPGNTSVNSAVMWSIRLPMTFTCVFVGASLGLAGSHMQTILNNPLASPYTLGISSSAGFGASLAILTGFTIGNIGWLSIPLMAFLFSFISSLCIYFIGKNKGMKSITMILTGIVIHFLFQALQSLVQYMSAPEVSQQIVFWMFGSLLKSSWIGVFVTMSIFIICLLLTTTVIWQITALSAGEERARSLGINVDKLKLKIFLIATLLTTGAVSFIGPIGFIGLISPHFARMSIGEDQRYLSPISAIFGALIMVVASIISKMIKPGAMIPIGIVTSIVGVPFLLFLLLSKGAE
ncbi:iron ABC transporter permease [Hathewaya histolytica]|uniref:ABC-type Fe3+-siderophore transport system, permease component n=1 Tax=Hathewaya histolytica TaxID=1498 RepID=A0A4U9RJB5_HATHI|nr:iron ABC transporter permease [Hathewaya histolytica]VTQ91406.1 ABC-type Fe3+-siderophore transport system, permease component [Hathewaya histolytica]